jgi:hypothetical protein
MSAGDSAAPRDQLEADAEAVLDGATRSLSSLAALRWILGETRQPTPASTVLHELADVVRVPLRDHGAVLRLLGAPDVEDEVDPTATVHALLSALRRVCEGPHGSQFAVELTVQGGEMGPTVCMRAVDEDRKSAHGRPLGLVLDSLLAEPTNPGAQWRAGDAPDQLALSLAPSQPNLSAS